MALSSAAGAGQAASMTSPSRPSSSDQRCSHQCGVMGASWRACHSMKLGGRGGGFWRVGARRRKGGGQGQTGRQAGRQDTGQGGRKWAARQNERQTAKTCQARRGEARRAHRRTKRQTAKIKNNNTTAHAEVNASAPEDEVLAHGDARLARPLPVSVARDLSCRAVP